MKKILFFPLYVGEFGWELMVWHSLFRKSKEDGVFDEVHGVCFEPFKVLYEDFVDELMFHTPPQRTLEPHHYTTNEHVEYLKKIMKDNDVQVAAAPDTVRAWNIPDVHKFVSYKQDVDKEYDAVFHLRHMAHRPEDNDSPEWSRELVERALDQGKKVALIGTSKGTLDLDLPVDKFYDKPLSEVIDVINKSKVVVGQSSGPMHLAALCEAETVVWSTTKGDGLRVRYEQTWNPFNNKVNYLVEPSQKDIIEIING